MSTRCVLRRLGHHGAGPHMRRHTRPRPHRLKLCTRAVCSMASLRDLVTGQGCSAGGAGGANAAASFADALLGASSSKAQEGQLRAPPGAAARACVPHSRSALTPSTAQA